MNDPAEGNSPSSSSEEPPKADDISNTNAERDAQETDQGESTGSQPPQPPSPPIYYTRSAARRLPPPSPAQLRAGKLLMKKIDRRPHRPHRPRPLTVVRQTTTSRIKPPVPPAETSPSGIVPLGPPPPREPRIAKSPPPAAPVVGRFDHLPPPSLSFDDAWKVTKDFVYGLEKEGRIDESKLKDLMLSLQVDLGLPPEVSLFDMFDSNEEMDDVIDFVWDYFQTSEVPPATISETKP